jgi:hypothetical protein
LLGIYKRKGATSGVLNLDALLGEAFGINSKFVTAPSHWPPVFRRIVSQASNFNLKLIREPTN